MHRNDVGDTVRKVPHLQVPVLSSLVGADGTRIAVDLDSSCFRLDTLEELVILESGHGGSSI